MGLHYLTWISSGGGKTKSALFAMEEEVVDHRPASVVLTVTIKSSCAMQCHIADLAVFVVEFPTMCLASDGLQQARAAFGLLQVALEAPCHYSLTTRTRVGKIQGGTPFARVED